MRICPTDTENLNLGYLMFFKILSKKFFIVICKKEKLFFISIIEFKINN